MAKYLGFLFWYNGSRFPTIINPDELEIEADGLMKDIGNTIAAIVIYQLMLEENGSLWEEHDPEDVWVTKYRNIVKHMLPLRYEEGGTVCWKNISAFWMSANTTYMALNRKPTKKTRNRSEWWQ